MKIAKQSFRKSKSDIKKQLLKAKKSRTRNKQILDELKSRFEVIVLLEGVQCPSCPYLATHKFLLDAHLHIDHELKSRSNPEGQNLSRNQQDEQDRLDEQDNLDEQDKQDNLDEPDDGCTQSRKRKRSAEEDEVILNQHLLQIPASIPDQKHPDSPSDHLNWRFCFEMEEPEQRILAINRAKRHLFIESELKIEKTILRDDLPNCSKCDKSFSSKASLKRHASASHKNLKKVPQKSTQRRSSIKLLKRVPKNCANNNKQISQKRCSKRAQKATK